MQLPKFNIDYADVPGAFQGWLKAVMKNTAIDFLRRKKSKKNSFISGDDSASVPSTYESGLDKISHKEILSAVNKLSPAYRTVFSLYVLENLRHKEIAKELGLSISTSKTNLMKARRDLKKMISQ